jgi:catechol O-methyltransferase
LGHKVKIVVGTADKHLPTLKQRFHIDKVDFFFIDHWKDRYLPDLQIAEKEGLVKKGIKKVRPIDNYLGTVIAADNVITPGTPEYLKYVRNVPHYKSTLFEATLEYTKGVKDGIELSVCIQDPVVPKA